ncbi:MAG: DNA-binding protein [Prevotellaceae bacterium]|nr:DNA-binding protein [Prevotellaceae bacterium]
MKVRVIVERGKDNKFSAFMDYYDLEFGLAGFGNTAKEAIQDFYESYDEEKEMCQREGKSIPELEFEIQYDMSSFLDYFSGVLSKSGLETITGINQKQLWHYSSGLRKPRPSTVVHIQNSLHAFADSIKQVHFM